MCKRVPALSRKCRTLEELWNPEREAIRDECLRRATAERVGWFPRKRRLAELEFVGTAPLETELIDQGVRDGGGQAQVQRVDVYPVVSTVGFGSKIDRLGLNPGR